MPDPIISTIDSQFHEEDELIPVSTATESSDEALTEDELTDPEKQALEELCKEYDQSDLYP